MFHTGIDPVFNLLKNKINMTKGVIAHRLGANFSSITDLI
jgi:hypothetical protein